jgi:hypothetical protein
VLLLPRSFHEPREWESKGQFYRRVGVERFRSIVANGDLVNRFVRRAHRATTSTGPTSRSWSQVDLEREAPHRLSVLGLRTAYYAYCDRLAGLGCVAGGLKHRRQPLPDDAAALLRARVLRLARLAERQKSSLFARKRGRLRRSGAALNA